MQGALLSYQMFRISTCWDLDYFRGTLVLGQLYSCHCLISPLKAILGMSKGTILNFSKDYNKREMVLNIL